MQIRHTPLVATSIGTRRDFVSFHFGTPGSGEKVYLQASLHADETPAMLTAWSLKRRLIELDNAGLIRGEVILVPVANPIGLAQHVLGQFIGRFELNSGHNFNRNFPLPSAKSLVEHIGSHWTNDADGNTRLVRRAICEMLADVVPKNEFESLRREMLIMSADADIILDLHCSLEATMHLYTNPVSWPAVEPLARYLGAKGVLLAADSGGQTFDEIYAPLWDELRALLGDATPLAAPNVALTVEHRGQRDVSYEFAEHDADAIVDFLVHRGVIDGDVRALPPLLHPATPLAGSEQFIAPVSGILVHRAAVGAHLKAGDPVFDIVDPITDAVTTLTTRNDGILYMRRAIRFVIAGAPLGRVSGAIPFRTGVLIGA
jgi:predicted deacylase